MHPKASKTCDIGAYKTEKKSFVTWCLPWGFLAFRFRASAVLWPVVAAADGCITTFQIPASHYPYQPRRILRSPSGDFRPSSGPMKLGHLHGPPENSSSLYRQQAALFLRTTDGILISDWSVSTTVNVDEHGYEQHASPWLTRDNSACQKLLRHTSPGTLRSRNLFFVFAGYLWSMAHRGYFRRGSVVSRVSRATHLSSQKLKTKQLWRKLSA
ncbi:uncharacterized protein BCR38DRAFT_105353 [Pseudomassariella vexata]|uniref:Uncharacterized protein n=1 Tax=Pseudomassariella vexata TaxID=1141098 RepID=A0A1Y2EFM0_9PEZI|nr:uncharacterized protein BCR38DRAFT_105353 [Pseudomassariella vexata]ORY70378.1 hypothetical protein BCR38DRAFT_105353 [Pseudomassariella vexata]